MIIIGTRPIRTGTIVTIKPGTYWIDGDLTLDDGATLQCPACVNGAGVTVILTTAGNVSLGSNAVLKLSAPNSGTFKGLVLVQDPNGLPASFSVGPNAALAGLVYFSAIGSHL